MKLLRKKRSKKIGLPPGSLVVTGDNKNIPANISFLLMGPTALVEKTSLISLDDLPSPKQDEVLWVQVDGVHDTNLIQNLGEKFGLHPLLLEDIVNTDQRPKLEDYDQDLFIVLKMFTCQSSAQVIRDEQVSLVLKKNIIISFLEDPGDVFDPVRDRIRKGRLKARRADFLLYSLIDSIVDHFFVVLEKLGNDIEVLEEDLVTRPSRESLLALYKLKRQMVGLRQSIWPLREVINNLLHNGYEMIEASSRIFFRDVYDHTVHVVETIETFRDMLSGMMDIYLSSVSNRMNEIMKVLTIISTIFIPLTFIVGVYGMNFDRMPELHWEHGYLYAWLLMLGVTSGMFIYFRKKKWF